LFNNNTTATCPQSLPVKKIWKLVNIWRRCRQSQSGTFVQTQCSGYSTVRFYSAPYYFQQQ